MNFGLTAEGFKRKRLEDIKGELESDFTDEFGVIQLGPDSVFGQLIGLLSKPLDELWQQAENVYYSRLPSSAEGVNLDEVAGISGTSRIPAQATRVTVSCFGLFANIPAGSKVSAQGRVMTTPTGGLTDIAAADSTSFIPNPVADATLYEVEISGTVYSYTSGVGATANSIAAGLVAAINSGTDAEASIVSDNAFIRRTDGQTFSVNTGSLSNLLVGPFSSPILFILDETGPIEIAAETVDQIETPVADWTGVTNYLPGVTGRNEETDDELRVRREESLRILGASTTPAIESRLTQEIPNIIKVRVFENDTDSVDLGGRPPHSIEVIAQGGVNQDIADKIYEVKAAGINTFGNTTLVVMDSNNDERDISFSRPDSVFMWFEFDIQLYDEEEYPDNGEELIKAAVVAQGDALLIDEDVIIQRYFKAVYSIPGVGDVVARVGTSTNATTPPSSFGTGNVPISVREVAQFDESRIAVTVV